MPHVVSCTLAKVAPLLMSPFRFPRTGLLLLLVGLAMPVPAARANWGGDGVRVVGPESQPASPVIVAGQSGAALVAWVDGRSGYNTDVRATSWGANGSAVLGWNATGNVVTNVACTRWDLAAAPDGAGGAFLSWSDNRCTGYRNIYVGRMLSWGVWPPTAQSSGVPIAPTASEQNASTIIVDAAGGAFVAWEDHRGADTDVYLQHVDVAMDLVTGWPDLGLAVAATSGVQEKPVLALDAAGGVFVAWLEQVAGTSRVRLQRYTADGLIVSGWPASGVSVATSTVALRDLRMIGDGVGGVLLAWADPQLSGTRIRAQRVRNSGGLASGWPSGGLAVCSATGDRGALRIASDGTAGLLLAWQDRRGADADLYLSHVAVNAAIPTGWPAQGLAVCTAVGDQITPDLASDGEGGAFVVWADRRDGAADLRATHVTNTGTIVAGWEAGGTPICQAAGEQSAPRLAVSGGEATVMWLDARDGAAHPALQLARLTASGPLPPVPTGLSARHHHGQTFLTWTSMPDTGWIYRVYQSATPITSRADLGAATLLGSVGDSTAFDRRLMRLRGGVRLFRVDSSAAPLDPTQSLFVLPAPASRQSYYAVTAQLRGYAEDRRVSPGGNALTSAVAELLETPRPVYQGPLDGNAGSPDVYTLWTWNVDTPLFPAMANRPSWPFDCGVLHGVAGGVGLVRPHPRGGDFAGQLVYSMTPNEWVLGLDDYTWNEDFQTWWYGYHSDYDLLGSNPASGPTTGEVIDYTNRRALHTIRWWRANFPFDIQRHYAFGYSMGGTASLRWGLTQPELFAAVLSSVGKIDFAIDDDPNPLTDFNTGHIYRQSLDRMWGPRHVSLPSSEGVSVYVANSGDTLARRASATGSTFVINFAGRNDFVVGWAEKPKFYAGLEAARLGGLQFWDSRDHTGTAIPGAFGRMLDLAYLTRFRLDRSWPAFSRCSWNGKPGNGTASSADSIGTINGYLDWEPVVADSATGWEVTLLTRKLETQFGTLAAPESLTVDVTPRRTQRFRPAPGSTIAWSAVRLSDGAVLQTGTATVDAAGLVTVPQVKVMRLGVRLRLGTVTGVLDAPGPRPTLPMLATFANPCGPRVALSGAWPVSGPAKLDLYDVAGRHARQLFSGVATAGAWRLSADLNGLAPGIYLLRAQQAGAQQQRRLVLVR